MLCQVVYGLVRNPWRLLPLAASGALTADWPSRVGLAVRVTVIGSRAALTWAGPVARTARRCSSLMLLTEIGSDETVETAGFIVARVGAAAYLAIQDAF